MPATGVLAPERTLVAVRAMAPVAGRPPTSGEAMLASPCAKSSTLELWRVPAMRSATTADISDSMAPSIATVNVGAISVRIRSGRNAGRCSVGQAAGDATEPRPDGRDRQLQHAAATVPPRSATM